MFGEQTLKDLEDSLIVTFIDADAIVFDAEQPFLRSLLGIDVNLRGQVSPIDDGISNQVLEQLHQLASVSDDDWKDLCCQFRICLTNLRFQVVPHFFDNDVAVGVAERSGFRRDARIGQKIVEQSLHPLGTVNRALQELVCFLIELPTVPPLQQLTIAGDRPQRSLQVMRNAVAKLF